MALEKIGLGAILALDSSQFTKGASTAKSSLAKLKKDVGRSVSQISSGFGNIGQGFQNIALAAAPIAVAVGAGAKAAMDFEHQMSAAQAVISGVTNEEMAQLNKEAKRLGILTKFSATEAAQGVEQLGRAGFDTKEIMASLGGVMDAAAADGLGLARTTEITTNILRGMGLEASQALRVADVLALTSAETTTNIAGLGASFRFAASAARSFKIPFEETAATLGVLADAGLKGSLGGTAFTNMLIKLSKPTEKATALMEKYNIQIKENASGGFDIASTFKALHPILNTIHSSMERGALVSEIFGIRGQRAVNGIDEAIRSGKFEKLVEKLRNAEGTARRMAGIRLDNVIGQFTLLTASLEGAGIAFFEPFLEGTKLSLKGVTDSLNNVLLVINDLREASKFGPGSILNEETMGMINKLLPGTFDQFDFANLDPGKMFGYEPKKIKTEFVLEGVKDKLKKEFGETAVEIALGVGDAITAVKNAFSRLGEILDNAKRWMKETFGETSIRRLTKIVIIVGLVAATLPAVALALWPIKLALSGIFTIIKGLALIVSGVLSPAFLIVAGVAALLFFALRKDGESVFDTLYRIGLAIWEIVKGFSMGVMPIVEMVIAIFEDLGESFKEVGAVFSEIWGLDGVKTDWKEVGIIIVSILAVILEVALKTVATIVKGLLFVINTFVKFFAIIAQGIAEIVLRIQKFFEKGFVHGMKKVGLSILNFVLKPIQIIAKAAGLLIRALGIDLPAGFKGFMDKGASSFFPELALDAEQNSKEADFEKKARIHANAQKTVSKRAQFANIPKKKRGRAADFSGGKKEGEMNFMDIFAKKATGKDTEDGTKGVLDKLGEIKAEMEKANNKETTTNVNVNMDGRKVAKATARHKNEIDERTGFKATPWQKRMAIEQGASPVVANGAG